MNPRFDIRFREDDHSYTVNGTALPSVTTVLESVLHTMAGIPEHLVEKAGTFGSHVHLVCELFDTGMLDEETLDPNLAPYLAGYKQFLFDKKPTWNLIEAPIASVKYGYAGMLDRCGVIGKADWQIDIKSSGAMPKTVGAQTAAYNEGVKETYGWSAKKRACLLLRPDGYILTELKDISDWSLFVSCLNVWKFRQKNCVIKT